VRKKSSSETDVKRSTETENTGKSSEAENDSLNASKVQDFKSNNSK
jgi:hypothetical protein